MIVYSQGIDLRLKQLQVVDALPHGEGVQALPPILTHRDLVTPSGLTRQEQRDRGRHLRASLVRGRDLPLRPAAQLARTGKTPAGLQHLTARRGGHQGVDVIDGDLITLVDM